VPAMGFFFKKTKPDVDLTRDGVRCRATVEHADMSRQGTAQMNLSSAKAESILSGELSPLRMKVRLRVEPVAGEPYPVKIKVSVPMMKAGWLRAGSTVEVLVDPDDPDRLAIDWDGAHEEGTIGALLADNPLARAALEGAGLDPDRVAREADDRTKFQGPEADSR
jgi:hypothetical protein